MITKSDLKFYWDLTQLVKEKTHIDTVKKFLVSRKLDLKINIFKTSKDEVLQVYDEKICYTIIGGSSADKKEWRSNFNVGKLAHGVIHEGFYNLATEVLHSESLVQCAKMIYIGHSRGGAAVSIISHLRGAYCVGFGTPKAFRRSVKLPFFTNVYNPLDPVCHVVPFFKRVGQVVKVNFLMRPHTQYGKHLEKI